MSTKLSVISISVYLIKVSIHHIRDVLLSKEQHQTETHVTMKDLYSESKANCFGDPSDLDTGSCGTTGTAIIRNSEDFFK